MKFDEIIKSGYHWQSIECVLLACYPDEKQSIEAYERVYETLQQLQPVETDFTILISWVIDDFDPNEIEEYADVSGYPKIPDSDGAHYSLGFTPWNEWLGMEIAPQSLLDFSELEIMAHCLYDMTFYGYTEEQIKVSIAEIEKISEEYHKLTEEEKNENRMQTEEFLKSIREEKDDKGT